MVSSGKRGPRFQASLFGGVAMLFYLEDIFSVTCFLFKFAWILLVALRSAGTLKNN